MVRPEILAPVRWVRGDSPGILFPFNVLSSLGPRLPSREGSYLATLRRLPPVPSTVPEPPTTVPLSGFLNLPATLIPLTALLPFSDRFRSWGCVLQGFVPFTKPQQLVANTGIPSWRSSHRLRRLGPRPRHRQAHGPLPRFASDSTSFVAFRVLLLAKIDSYHSVY